MRKILFFTVLFSFFAVSYSFAEITIPEKVKIGLYSGASALQSVNLKGQQGVLVGFNKDNKFNTLYEDTSENGILIKKDAYQYGPYHVQIGSSCPNKYSVDKKVQELKSKNINPYPVYCNGSWYVWHGLFRDADTAEQAINSNLIPAIGNDTYSIIQPSSQRLCIMNGDSLVMMFEGTDSYLGVRSKHSSDLELISVNGGKFRGEVEIRRYADSDMTVINILPLEEYLYGVVPREIGGNSALEAVKAQAVAARTYAVQNRGKRSKWGFDMTNTDLDQVYGGYGREVANSNKGVDETKGKILLYKGVPASTFYFSTSGGVTEDVKNVWGSEGYPYLVSVEDKYENYIPGCSKWEVTLTGAELGKRLKQNGFDLGDVIEIKPMEYSDAGRVIKLYIKGTKGEKTFEKGKCRTVIRIDRDRPKEKEIKSQWYTVSTGSNISVLSADGKTSSVSLCNVNIKTAEGVYNASQSGSPIIASGADGTQKYSTASSDGFKFVGKGWGHGIGMSQNGAIGMAKAGFTYDKILAWYFKGTYVE